MKLQNRLRSIIRLFPKPRPTRKTHTETIQLSLQRLEERQVLNAAGGDVLLFSTGGNETFPDQLEVQASDIVQYDGSNFALFFDGEDVGLGGQEGNIDALAMIGENQLLLSFYSEISIAGLGSVGPSDIVLFEADSLGENTSGTFSLFASAGELGLKPTDNIDALDLLDDGSLVISTLRDTTVSAGSNGGTITVRDQDLLQIIPDAFGNFSTGTRQLIFDGTNEGLDNSSENINGVSIEGLQIRLSTFGGNSIPQDGIGGSSEDVLTFSATQLGTETAGSFTTITFDGKDAAGFTFNLDALDYAVLNKPSTPPTAQDLDLETFEDQSLSIQLQGDDGDPDVQNALMYQIVDAPTYGDVSGFDPATGTLIYTPDANFHGEDQLTYFVQEVDARGNILTSEVAVVQITVTAVNDAPIVMLPAGPLTGKEDVPLQISGIRVGDVEADSHQQPVAVTLRVEHGILVWEGLQPGVQVIGHGTREMTLIGTITEINSLLAEGLLFRPDINFSGQAAIEVSIQDGLNPDLALSAVGRVEIDILSTREQATAFRDQVFELLERGELGRQSARRLLNAVKLNGHGRQVEKTIDKIERWEAKGRLDSDVAERLTSQLADLHQGAITGRFEKLDAVFSQIGKAKLLRGLARLRGGR